MAVKRMKIPKVLTGKQVACIIEHSTLRWNNEDLRVGNTYCALGMIARHAGVSPAVIDNEGTPEGTGIPQINDGCKSRKEVIHTFGVEYKTREFRVGDWIDRLLRKQKGEVTSA